MEVGEKKARISLAVGRQTLGGALSLLQTAKLLLSLNHTAWKPGRARHKGSYSSGPAPKQLPCFAKIFRQTVLLRDSWSGTLDKPDFVDQDQSR